MKNQNLYVDFLQILEIKVLLFLKITNYKDLEIKY